MTLCSIVVYLQILLAYNVKASIRKIYSTLINKNLPGSKLRVIELLDCIKDGGVVYGAFSGNKLIGFASLKSVFFGRKIDYLEMQMMQVSSEYRRNGIGRQLFSLIVQSARNMGARKIYISAHSSEESQAFYKAIGCVEAEEYNQVIAENEPFDCQMEYII